MRNPSPVFALALMLGACTNATPVDELYASLAEIAHESCTCEELAGGRPVEECTAAWAELDARQRPCHDLMQERYPDEIAPTMTCVAGVLRDTARCLRENECGATADCDAVMARWDDCPELPDLNDPEIDECF